MSNSPLNDGKYLQNKRYKIVNLIKAGGFGETYVVFDHNLQTQMALKRLKLYQSNSPQTMWWRRMMEQVDQAVWENAKKKFAKEAEVLRFLGQQHPQIPTIYDRFDEDNEFYIVQELIAGQDLSKELGQQKQSEEYVVKLIWEVLQILEFVHQSAIHRDISPNNIMRRRDGRLVLVDFGNVKLIRVNNSNPEGWVSATCSAIFTEGFTPPEQMIFHTQRNSDIYALGMVAVYALTGIYPNQLPKDNLEVRWLDHAVGINPNLGAIVNRMVRYDCRRERYQNVGEVITDLQQHFPHYAPSLSTVVRWETNSMASELPRTQAIPGILPLSQLSETLSKVAKAKPKTWELVLCFCGSALVTVSVSLVLKAIYTIGSLQILAIYVFVFSVILLIRYKFFPKQSLRVPGQNNQTIALGNGVNLEMIAIPGGTFQMGDEDFDWAKPVHSVNVKPFYLGKYPITQEQYQVVMGTNPSHFKGAKRPVENVSWHDAVEFCKKLSQKTGNNYRLPSEAEWEYACRAGTQTKYYFGDDEKQLEKYAWYEETDYRKGTKPIGQKKSNNWGLYDMYGNVWEWCLDEWHENYNAKPQSHRDNGSEPWGEINVSKNNNRSRVLRGGSWYNDARDCRSGNRSRFDAEYGNDSYGFRVACLPFLPRTP
jgi:eukaryotic-like serine/threonine-protein kinase